VTANKLIAAQQNVVVGMVIKRRKNSKATCLQAAHVPCSPKPKSLTTLNPIACARSLVPSSHATQSPPLNNAYPFPPQELLPQNPPLYAHDVTFFHLALPFFCKHHDGLQHSTSEPIVRLRGHLLRRSIAPRGWPSTAFTSKFM
jgi:hypothetical protein